MSLLGRDGTLVDEWIPPELEDVASLAWSSDGARLWLGTSAALRLWRTAVW